MSALEGGRGWNRGCWSSCSEGLKSLLPWSMSLGGPGQAAAAHWRTLLRLTESPTPTVPLV